MVGDFGRFQQHIHRHNYATRFKDTEIDDQELGNVRQHHGYLLALFEAIFNQGVGKNIGCAVKLAVGHFEIVKNDGGLGRVAFDAFC